MNRENTSIRYCNIIPRRRRKKQCVCVCDDLMCDTRYFNIYLIDKCYSLYMISRFLKCHVHTHTHHKSPPFLIFFHTNLG